MSSTSAGDEDPEEEEYHQDSELGIGDMVSVWVSVSAFRRIMMGRELGGMAVIGLWRAKWGEEDGAYRARGLDIEGGREVETDSTVRQGK